MSVWLYQIDSQNWSPNRYRFELWEGERWSWGVGRKVPANQTPESGDIVTFFYAKSAGLEPGFYGWAVVLEWYAETNEMYFRTVAPSDWLKMDPWWDKEAAALADAIRGKVKQGTMWLLDHAQGSRLRQGVQKWLSGTRRS